MARKRNRSRGRSGSGISRRSLLLLAGTGAVSATGAYTTGAFDSVAGDRTIDIGTAGDSDALLTIVPEDDLSGSSGDRVTLFTLTNRFGTALEIDAEIFDGVHGPVDPDLDAPGSLQPGTPGEIAGTLSCSSDRQETIEVKIEASGPSESVELIRPVTVSCSAPTRCEVPPRGAPDVEYVDSGQNGGYNYGSVTTVINGVRVNGGIVGNGDLYLLSGSEVNGGINVGNNTVYTEVDVDDAVGGGVVAGDIVDCTDV